MFRRQSCYKINFIKNNLLEDILDLPDDQIEAIQKAVDEYKKSLKAKQILHRSLMVKYVYTFL